MNIGDVFLMPTPPNGNHWFFAIAITDEGKYLCVNVESMKPGLDTTCILSPDDQTPDFIIHDSVITYKKAREISTSTHARSLANGSSIAKGSCSPQLLKRIQEGALKTRKIAKKHKETVEKFLMIS